MLLFPISHGSTPRKYKTDETLGKFFQPSYRISWSYVGKEHCDTEVAVSSYHAARAA